MVIISAILESFRSLKDRTLKVSFETGEPTPEQMQKIAMSSQKFGILVFAESEKEGEVLKVMENIPKTDLEFGKTRSQRLRGVLYRLWESNKEGYDNSEDHYNAYMEKIIKHFKSQIK